MNPLRVSRWTLVWVLLGWSLRLSGLGVHSLWFDELTTVRNAEAPDFVGNLLTDRHPPLSFALFRVWIAAFGAEDWSLRLLPALVSCVSLVLFARLARAWLQPGAATAALALQAVSPFDVWYGQEVRPYAFLELELLAGLLATVAYLSGPANARSRRLGSWLLLAVATALAILTHYSGVLIGFSVLALGGLARARGRVSTRRLLKLLTAPAAGALATAPWTAWAVPRQMATDWPYLAQTGLRELAELPVRFVITEPDVVPEAWRWLVVLLGALLLVGLAVFLVLVGRCLGGERERASREPAVLAALVAPVIGAFVLGLVGPLVLLPRYLMSAAPAMTMAVAAGAWGLRPAALGRALLGLVLAGCLTLTLMHKAGNRRDDYRSACRELAEAWRPGDGVVSISGLPEHYSQAGLRHYLRGRPEITAAIEDPALWLGLGSKRLAPGERLHVIYRDAEFARAPLAALESRARRVQAGERRFRLQHLLLEGVAPVDEPR